MNSKMHKNNFRNFKQVILMKNEWYFSFKKTEAFGTKASDYGRFFGGSL